MPYVQHRAILILDSSQIIRLDTVFACLTMKPIFGLLAGIGGLIDVASAHCEWHLRGCKGDVRLTFSLIESLV